MFNRIIQTIAATTILASTAIAAGPTLAHHQPTNCEVTYELGEGTVFADGELDAHGQCFALPVSELTDGSSNGFEKFLARAIHMGTKDDYDNAIVNAVRAYEAADDDTEKIVAFQVMYAAEQANSGGGYTAWVKYTGERHPLD